MSKTDVKALLEAGAHFGHKTSRWNPKMRRYIHSQRGGIYIIDLVKTVDGLEKATKFTESVAAEGKDVLFVGTKRHLQEAVQAAAEDAGMPYVVRRWFGGMLTNFETISSRIKQYKTLISQLESGELEDEYTKREIGEFEEERDKLAFDFAGIADMTQLPGALFAVDTINDKTAVREANRLGIPVIGIADTNSDPDMIDYVIPANDDAVKTVTLIANEIAASAKAGAATAAKQAAKREETAKTAKQPDVGKTKSKETAKASEQTGEKGTTAKPAKQTTEKKPAKPTTKKATTTKQSTTKKPAAKKTTAASSKESK